MNSITPVARLDGHKGAVLCVKYAQDSILGDHVLASGAEDNSCRLWDLRQARAIKGIQKLGDAVSSIAFATQKPLVYLASGKKVYAFDLRNEGLILTTPAEEYEFSDDEINSIDVRDNFLVTGDDQGDVKVVDMDSNKIYKKLVKKHNSICMAVRFRARKPWEVWSGGLDCQLFQWDFSRGTPMNITNTNETAPGQQQMFNPPFVYSLDTSSDGQWVGAGLGDGSLQLVHGGKKGKAKEMRFTDAHNHLVNCLSFLPSTKGKPQQLLSGSANGSVKLWDLTDSIAVEPEQAYQLDPTMARLNWLEYCSMDEGRIAAAGVGQTSNLGALHIYSIM
ncbi:wd40 repeat-containing protein [Lichtheimia corymbifera JMRC:FSU:9682]|uniref:Wd40 repeat-containing protein n=1 Tax=Lichtheimia corymbifera JMRC:FSU:9682 TaxID=1263082 RepID=A0A068RMC6_9FUNG|nr:wd40 repeat-containing protein [Lichtheimia corymbifera JMRC:FSU:9682]